MTADKFHQIMQYLRTLFLDTKWQGLVYAVGGCCRDLVLGREINDIDLAVTLPNGSVSLARWLERKHLLAGAPVVIPRYATAMFSLREFPDVPLETVQTRSRKYTEKTAHNPRQCFGTIEQDAHLRDLTINTLFYDIASGEIIDTTGQALNDIASQILRTPASPAITLTDDPLRVLRIIRFAAQLGWRIDPMLFRQLADFAPSLSDISTRRLHGELRKMMLGPDLDAAHRLMQQAGLDKAVAPYLQTLSLDPPEPLRPTPVRRRHTHKKRNFNKPSTHPEDTSSPSKRKKPKKRHKRCKTSPLKPN